MGYQFLKCTAHTYVQGVLFFIEVFKKGVRGGKDYSFMILYDQVEEVW